MGVFAALRRRAVEGGSYRVVVSLTRTVLWQLSLGIFDKSYAQATAGSTGEHTNVAPDVFTREHRSEHTKVSTSRFTFPSLRDLFGPYLFRVGSVAEFSGVPKHVLSELAEQNFSGVNSVPADPAVLPRILRTKKLKLEKAFINCSKCEDSAGASVAPPTSSSESSVTYFSQK